MNGYINIYKGIHVPFVCSKRYNTFVEAERVGKCFPYYLTTIDVARCTAFFGGMK